MGAFVQTLEVDRRPEEIFAYLDQLERHTEWQDQLVSVVRQTEGPTRVGTRARETRKIGSREMTGTYEITEHDPPSRFAFKTLEGPIRPFGHGTIEPIGDGSRSRYTITLDFEARGLGKLMLPLVRRQAAKQFPKDAARLKERLEAGA